MRTSVELKAVSKSYGDQSVIRQLNLKIKPGEIVALLGLNGAGKTTTIKMMLGLTKVTSGEIKYFGKNFEDHKAELLPRIGSVIEHPGFYEHLSVYDNLKLITNVLGLHQSGHIDDLLRTVELEHMRFEKVKNLNLPDLQKLAMGRALLNNPSVLLLDEPFTGLDIRSINALRNLMIRLAKERNTSILISSHALTEVEKIADRIAVLHKGKILKVFDQKYLSREKMQRVVIRSSRNLLLKERLQKSGLKHAFIKEDYLYLNQSLTPKALRDMVDLEGIEVFEMYPKALTLEDYFFELLEVES